MPEDNTTISPTTTPTGSDPQIGAPEQTPIPSLPPVPGDTSAIDSQPAVGDVNATIPESNTTTSVPTMPLPSAPAATLPSQPSLPDNKLTITSENNSIYAEVAGKISEAHNVLIALSSDPSVDEMSAAIGLSLYLDKLGKRATAIYSGTTPNALEFLKPEETFEPSADTLQDFVIALNKEKADHLRYKLDGDYVKVYITPYRARISEEDLEFSYGDYNVDLVLALDVANGIDLDSALREHGRIMHDASIINITTSNPGKFGETEWSDKKASSVSEMIAKLLYSVSSDVKIDKDEATAFLTGIVAATNRFSNAKTTPETMTIASLLMKSGANQQLVSKNITPDVDNELAGLSLEKPTHSKSETDHTKLDIEHDEESSNKSGQSSSEDKEINADVTKKEHTLLDDLKAAEASLAQAGAETTPEASSTRLKIDSHDSEAPSSDDKGEEDTKKEEPKSDEKQETEPIKAQESTNDVADIPTIEPPTGTTDAPSLSSDSPSTNSDSTSDKPADNSEAVLTPPSDLISNFSPETDSGKYAQMLEDAISSPEEPKLNSPAPMEGAPATNTFNIPTFGVANPATNNTPTVPSNPEINGVPEINYSSTPVDELLPPPPAPNIDSFTPPDSLTPPAPITPAAPAPEPTPTPLGQQPAMQDQVYAPQASDPASFKIPGM